MIKFKKRLAHYRWATISLRQPQPQNVTLYFGYSLMKNYKHFQRKYCESLRVRVNKIKFVNLTRSPTAQKMKETADLVAFTEEILNGKLHFCAVTLKKWGGCKQKLLQLVQWSK